MYLPLKIPPGMARNGTEYQNAGRWTDGSLVRFSEGTIRPIGGWDAIKNSSNAAIAFTGVPRTVHAWKDNSGQLRIAVGTHSKLYQFTQGVLSDITPAGFTTGGADTAFTSGLYGSGSYGYGTYGIGDPAQGSETDASVWSLSNFGQNLVGCMNGDGKLYEWALSGVATAMTGAPTGCVGLVVTPERFVFALGAGGDPRKVQWADQESTSAWTPSATNQAGDLILEGAGRLRCGRATRGETLLWTDTDAWVARYIGGTLVYSFERVGTGCGVISANAAVALDGQAVWMGRRGFFTYNGFVTPLASDVVDAVFSDFNDSQRAKVVSYVNSRFGEVWWFYPSAGSNENDRYVVWNYRENHWTTGVLSRSGGIDAGAYGYPLLATSTGGLYQHESGWDHGSAVPYLESGPVEVGNGDRVFMARQLVPDERTLGDVNVTFTAAAYPMAGETVYGPYTLSQKTDIRLTARQVKVKLTEVVEGDWRVGVIRLEGTLGGGR